jgi:integrase
VKRDLIVVEEVIPGEARAAKKLRTAKLRGTLFGEFRDADEDLKYTESRAVKAPTRQRYNESWEETRAFAKEHGLSLQHNQLDDTMVEIVDALFFEGEGLSAGQFAMAAALWKNPSLGRGGKTTLPRTRRALKGWATIHPPRSRAPLPRAAAALMIAHIARVVSPRIALALWLGLECYLRPGELLLLRVCDIIPPASTSAKGGAGRWGVRLHPQELGRPSKTGVFDSTVMLDLERHSPIFPFLVQLRARAKPDELLVDRSYEDLVKVFHNAAKSTGVAILCPVLYSLRHSGASADSADLQRDLKSVKMRGRWAADVSLRRYRKPGLVNVELNRLPQALREKALLAERRIDDVLAGRFQ